MTVELIHGDALEVLRTLPDNSVDAIVTDPPAGIGFMGKQWDTDHGGRDNWIAAFAEIARECLRVVKPGAHALVWAIPRTSHWTATAWENGGWEVRDRVAHVFGSGFPKSLDVSKAIDKAAGHERGTTPDFRNGPNTRPTKGIGKFGGYPTGQDDLDAGPATDAAKEHAGKGTALKPAMEDWWLLRKPLTGTIAANVMQWGTGALNIDACRVGYVNDADKVSAQPQGEWTGKPSGHINEPLSGRKIERDSMGKWEQPAGRWPAHLIHDGSDEVVVMFPQTQPSKAAQRGELADIRGNKYNDAAAFIAGSNTVRGHDDNGGSAARFFQACRPDETCSLCCLPCAEASDTIEAWLHLLARTVEKNGWTTQATNGFIARINAIGKQNERLVRNVKSAGNLCDSCAMSIAVALVGIKTSAFSSEELQVILASTGSCENSILIQSLVFFAGLWENTATIPTTTSLSILFGFVHHAIESYIKQGRTAGAGEGNGQEQATLFRYSPKASKQDRDEGLEAFQVVAADGLSGRSDGSLGTTTHSRNHHPTVKSTALMRWLIRLITPLNGVVLDCFMGSGSTGKAAVLEGFGFIGIERDAEYIELARARIAWAEAQPALALVE